jgi:ABC-type multidrug transport system fused ATPase/permease subunit
MVEMSKFYSPKWLAYSALIVSVVNACGNPVFGLIFSKLLFVTMAYMLPTFEHDRNFWCGMFVILAVVMGMGGALQKGVYGYIGENLTFKVRKLLFESIIYKHVSWFDSKDKAPGVLTNILSEDITELNGLSTETINSILEGVFGFVIGIILACIFTWQMALITLGFTPFVFVGIIIQANLQWKVKTGMKGKEGEDVDYYTESNALLSDVIMNYRTVISFG